MTPVDIVIAALLLIGICGFIESIIAAIPTRKGRDQ